MLNYIQKTSLIKLLLVFLVIGFITYVSSFTNLFVWDDDQFFHQNIFTQSLTQIPQIFTSNTTAGAGVSSNYYRPLTTLSFAFDHQLWGWNPIGFHLTNTVFHIANCMLLFLLLLLLRFRKNGAFLISLLFLIHPIQTEAVTYLSSRGDIFYTFFLLLSLHCFTIALYKKGIFIELSKRKLSISRGLLLTLSVLFFPLSILSKEGALTTVPIYAGVLLVFLMQKKLTFKQLHKTYRGHIIALFILIWLTLIYLGLRLTVLNFQDSLNYGGGQSLYTKNLVIRMLTFLKTILIYIRLLIVPYPLYLERSTEIVTSPLNGWALGSIVLLTSSLIVGWIELLKKHTVWIFFALILIFSNLLSVSGVIPMTALLRENWLYMPMIGFYIIIYIFALLFFKVFVDTHKKIIAGGFIVYVLILITLTIQQNYNWRNRIAYFEHNLRFTNTARLHLNLGNAYLSINNFSKATYHLKEAKKIEDAFPQTEYNLGTIYFRQGDLKHAEQEYLNSLEIDPNYLFSYSFLIQIYEKEHAYKKELPYLKRLTQIYPNDLRLQVMYAKALWDSGEKDKAKKEFTKAVKLSHNDPKLIEAVRETQK